MELSLQDIYDLQQAIRTTHRYYINADRPTWLEDCMPRLTLLSGRLEKEYERVKNT